MLLGFVSYGLSVVLFINAMRVLGAARTTAFFGTAPFVGAILSILLLHNTPSPLFFFASVIMIGGAILLLGEKHGHEHGHQNVMHEHCHNHDDCHHNHVHQNDEFVLMEDKHSHIHTHDAIKHSHMHTPDIHHRHQH